MKHWLVFLLLLFTLTVFGQTTPNGSQLTSPLTFVPPSGGSPVTYLDLYPGNATNPCPTLAQTPPLVQGAVRLCPSVAPTDMFGIDFGAGYVSGTEGPAGPPGTAATITVGTTTTGAPGTNASVVNVGTPSAAKFNFTIPAGVAGATGATGPTGPQGPAGPTWSSCSFTITSPVYSATTGTLLSGTITVSNCH